MHLSEIEMINNIALINIFEKPIKNSKISSQMLYGEQFRILEKKKDWLKIITKFDNYSGYIKNFKFLEKFTPTHKVYKLKSKIFKRNKNKFIPTKKFLYFASKISVNDKSKKYFKFEKNNWILKRDIKKIDHYEENFSKLIKLFLNTKYLWGGKSAAGIDCSALIQMFFFYNGLYFKRDTKDQIKFLKKNVRKNNFNKKHLIFWKGHVAYCLNKKYLIHAYGPRKKVLIMNIKKTIMEIQKNSNLKVIGVKKIDVN